MTLLEPFTYPFMLQAMAVGVIVGAACAVLSCFLVLRGWSLMGDAISHSVLPGVVLAYVAGLPFAVGAFAAGMLCALATGFLSENSRVKEDTVMGVVFTGFFAVGLVLFTKIKSDLHLDHILFGNILGVTAEDLRNTAMIGGIALVVVLALRRDLLLFCFDPGHARTIGLRTRSLYYLLLSLLAVTIVVSLQAVGIILVVAMLITPGCVGYLLSARFGRMLWIAAASAIFSNVLGVYLSFFLNAASGACIVLIQALVFLAALFFAPKHGLLTRRMLPASGVTAPITTQKG